MADRSTKIPGNQIQDGTLRENELDITNTPTDGQILKINMPTGDFTAIPSAERKVDSFTYDVSTTGSLAITGIGFKPSLIYMIGGVPNTGSACWTFFDGTTTRGIHSQHEETADDFSANSQFTITTASSQEAYLTLTSFDNDGFTLNKSKSGAPTGTGNIKFIAFR